VSALLELKGVSKSFGGLAAVRDVSIEVQAGEIVGLIGPNGAGKTTLVNVITGVHRRSSGEVRFEGKDISTIKPYQAAKIGLARTFQIVQPFPDMTVRENAVASCLFGGGMTSLRAAEEAAAQALEFVGLQAEAEKLASALTLASRKRLELAKSIAMRPRLLLLDEVNAGLNSAEVDGAVALIRRIAQRGIAVILIEHLLKVVTSVCERVVVLHHGELIADGPTHTVMSDERVVSAYLGGRYKRMRAQAGAVGASA
jgi:branched-chain amino acid transport system ATP-binding protein